MCCVFRYILASGGCTTVIGCRNDDIIYCTLPLYHSVGGMIALAGTMKHGISMAMRRKFSAKNFWADCVKYHVTVSSINTFSWACMYTLHVWFQDIHFKTMLLSIMYWKNREITSERMFLNFYPILTYIDSYVGCRVHWRNM